MKEFDFVCIHMCKGVTDFNCFGKVSSGIIGLLRIFQYQLLIGGDWCIMTVITGSGFFILMSSVLLLSPMARMIPFQGLIMIE